MKLGLGDDVKLNVFQNNIYILGFFKKHFTYYQSELLSLMYTIIILSCLKPSNGIFITCMTNPTLRGCED